MRARVPQAGWLGETKLIRRLNLIVAGYQSAFSRPAHSLQKSFDPDIKHPLPQYHPDKNPDDPTAADRFKEIAVAYTTLSDPKLRKQYNEFGRSKKDGGTADEAVDPEVIFSTLFGGKLSPRVLSRHHAAIVALC